MQILTVTVNCILRKNYTYIQKSFFAPNTFTFKLISHGKKKTYNIHLKHLESLEKHREYIFLKPLKS